MTKQIVTTSKRIFKNLLYFSPRENDYPLVKTGKKKLFRGLIFQYKEKKPRKESEYGKRRKVLMGEYFNRRFIQTWLAGVTKALDAARNTGDQEVKGADRTQAKVKNLEIIMKSRGDLSAARSDEENKRVREAEGTFGSKGFYGTPLPLIPDIRSSEVVDGVFSTLLESLGVRRKFDRNVVLYRGPNKKANRYLIFQYKRMIKTLEGQIVSGNPITPAHVVWKYDFYKIFTNAPGAIIPHIKPEPKWKLLREHLYGIKEKPEKQISRRKLIKLAREVSRKYWSIGVQLSRSSIAFRMAVIKSAMGSTGRWFHRHFDLKELFDINAEYQKIADTFGNKMEIKRRWINTEQHDGTRKWRPLGLSSWAWRIYTRGINNILETYVACGWPKNQHGYKSGRGVHTVWNQVLQTIIKAKNIIEFDFRGFFNTVNVEAVGKTLHQFMIPKYMIANLVLINSGDVKNINIAEMLNYVNSVDPDEAGWRNAWRKYEYIHNYRKGYRHRGLAQGGVLSPMLSVLTLIVLDELEAHGIKYILYCDDGLFYSDTEKDALSIAQEILDRHNIGAHFATEKCSWVKKEDEWIKKLKLVGLEYDPFTDVLAANTRNGATLKLEIGTLGIFSENKLNLEPLLEIKEEKWQDWIVTNQALFKAYEQYYLSEQISGNLINSLTESLSLQTYDVMKQRLQKFDPWTLKDILMSKETTETTFLDFIGPLRLLKSIKKDYFYELVDKYESINSCDFPHELLKRPYIKDIYWMDNVSGDKLKTLKEEKRSTMQKVEVNQISEDKLAVGTKPIIEALVAFHQLRTLPESLKMAFKDNELNLGDWIATSFNEAGIKEISPEIAKHMNKYQTWLGYTQVTWRHLYMDPMFATFIARLFQNSFESNIVKQNFKLTHNSDKQNLLKLVYKFVGKQALDVVLDEGGLNVFNSSSVFSNLLKNLLDTWTVFVKKPNSKRISMYEAPYKGVVSKIAHRGSYVDDFPDAWSEEWGYSELDWHMINETLKSTDTEQQNLIQDIPLTPLVLLESEKHREASKHIFKKYKNVASLDIETITRSAISTFARHTTLDLETGKKVEKQNTTNYKSTRWDTFSPRRDKHDYNLLMRKGCLRKAKKRNLSPSVSEVHVEDLAREKKIEVFLQKEHPLL
jgi:hypothetical protein